MDFEDFHLNKSLEAVGHLKDPNTYSLKPIQTAKNSGENINNNKH
jgi:hypothetical protein